MSRTRTALFIGPPGVGKTLSARWIASQLNLPLMVLDLSAVMSSFLGRTGNNVRSVLDYAKKQQCVLLLDELDAIAKRRDDATEIGELKRLVTVLIQEVDNWPSSGMLIAATNHPELLDTAVWRRFDHVIKFPTPDHHGIQEALDSFIGRDVISQEWKSVLSAMLNNCSYSDIERTVQNIMRRSVLRNTTLETEIEIFAKEWAGSAAQKERIKLTKHLSAVSQLSQRRISEITGVSRDTIRSRTVQKSALKLDEGRNG